MHLTVALCTWNRSGLLAQALTHLTALQVPEDTTWELLVVDNNSTDDTRAVIASFEGRLPIRCLFEPTPGVCNARNRAVGEAAGAYILWIDDDVLVEPAWMTAYASAFARTPAAGFFGGVIRPWFPQDPPEWLRRGLDYVRSAYAARDFGPEEFALAGDRVPFGANMAVRIAEQRAFLYDTALGPRPGSNMKGEETDMFARMLTSGVQGSWVPGAVVRHLIPLERQSVGYVRAYYMGHGEFVARTNPAPASTPRLFGKPWWLWRSAIQTEVMYRLSRVLQGPERWVPRLRDAGTQWGRLMHS